MTVRTAIFSLTCLFLSLTTGPVLVASAQQDMFPFLAESTGDSVNVRAGQSSNFEWVCQLSKGDEVIVLGKEFSWYKIQLPETAKSYINKEYVQYLGQNAGGITAREVNIRAGAGIHHTILGQLDEGEQIYILEDLEDWYRIEPVAGSYGWVAEDYLAFKSADTGGYTFERPRVEIAKPVSVPESTDSPADEKIRLEFQEEIGTAEEAPDTGPVTPYDRAVEEKLPENKGVISVEGRVESFKEGKEDGIPLKIVKDGRTVCYVLGSNHILGRFVGQDVSVDGVVSHKLLSRYGKPVISVVKIRLNL